MENPKIRFKGFTKDWEQQFSELVTIERGGSPRPIDKFITNDENGLNLRLVMLQNRRNYITQTAEKIRPEGLSKTREMVHPGDLILSNSMSIWKTIYNGDRWLYS